MKFIVFAFGTTASGSGGERSCSLDLIRDIVKPWLTKKGLSVVDVAKVIRSTLVSCTGEVDSLDLPGLVAEFRRYIVEEYLRDNTGKSGRAGYPTIYLDRIELRAVVGHGGEEDDSIVFDAVVKNEV